MGLEKRNRNIGYIFNILDLCGFGPQAINNPPVGLACGHMMRSQLPKPFSQQYGLFILGHAMSGLQQTFFERIQLSSSNSG
jgi:hypothetical protein